MDEALAKLGTIGPWQVLYFTIISTVCMVPSCFQAFAINYIGIVYACQLYFVINVQNSSLCIYNGENDSSKTANIVNGELRQCLANINLFATSSRLGLSI